MSDEQSDGIDKGPLLRFEPLIILDKVAVRPDRIKGQKGCSVQVPFDRDPTMQRDPRNVRRLYGDRPEMRDVQPYVDQALLLGATPTWL